MTTTPVFSFVGVEKRFGTTEALSGISLQASPGTVIGLIGRNGAGKTTALRCLLGLQRPTQGKISVFGEEPTRLSVAAKQRIGAMLDGGLPFPTASAHELFNFVAPLYPRWDPVVEANLCRRFEIDRRCKIEKLSLGQQRAVALALALCPRPDLLVLDEPAANLDPVLRRQFLAEVLDLVADEGRTVLFSSHNLGDVERITDRVAFLHQGRLLLDRPTEELRERMRRLRFIFPGDAPAKVDLPGLLASRRSGRELLLTVDGLDPAAVSALERSTGATIDVAPLGLEDLFVDLVGRDDGQTASAA